MAKKIFQRPFFCERLTCITLICNHKAKIRPFFRRNIFSQVTPQKMKFFINNFLSKCDQIHRKLRIWLHLLKKSLMKNVIFSTAKFLNYSKGIWGNHLIANRCQNENFCDTTEIWKKLKKGSFLL